MIRKYKIEIGGFIFLQLVFLLIQLFFQNYLKEDSLDYLQTAGNLIDKGIFYSGDFSQAINPALYTNIAPIYPLLLTVKSLFNNSLLAIILIQIILSVASFLLMLKVFQPKVKQKLLLMGLVLLFPSQFIYPNLILPQTLFQFVIMLTVFIYWTFLKTNNTKFLWCYQALLVLCILINTQFVMLIVPNLILFIILYFKSHQRLVLISGLLPIIFIIIFSGINQSRTGYYHLSSIGHLALVDEKIHTFLLNEKGIEAADSIIDQIHSDCRHEKDLRKSLQCMRKSAKELIKSNQPSYVISRIKSSIWLFLDPGKSDLMDFFSKKNTIQEARSAKSVNIDIRSHLRANSLWITLLLIFITLINLFRSIGFFFFLFNKHVRIEFRVFLLLIITVIVLTAGAGGSAQYMLPGFFILTGCAVYQYAQLINRFSKGGKKPVIEDLVS